MSRRTAGFLSAWCPLAVAGLALILVPRSEGQPLPAGSTAAVLSFIDAAAGRAEVVRHWPGAPVDVDVYPYVPYVWGGCPGSGATMMLITGAGIGPPIGVRVVRALLGSRSSHSSVTPSLELSRIAVALVTPGDPAVEAIKAAAPWISDLRTYERDGYAVFLLIHWQVFRCGVTLVSVPEGYAIPYVD